MKAYNSFPIRFARLLRPLCPTLILMILISKMVLPGAGLPEVVITGSGPSAQLSDPLFVIPGGAVAVNAPAGGRAVTCSMP